MGGGRGIVAVLCSLAVLACSAPGEPAAGSPLTESSPGPASGPGVDDSVPGEPADGTVPTVAGPDSSTRAAPLPERAGRCPRTGFTDGRLRVAGVRRTYGVSAPADPSRERTLLVNLHGTGGSIAVQNANTGLDALGTVRGWVVVTPQALGSPVRWNWQDDPLLAKDIRFIDRLISRAIKAYCLGRDARVLVVGGSNGAFMAGFTACRDTRIDGVAMVIGTAPASCPTGHRVPMLTIRGTADTTVPYSTALPFTQTWVDHARCRERPGATTVWPGVTRTRWFGCRDRATVAIDTVRGGVHAWPGAGLRAATNSQAGLTYPASERIVEFFETSTSTPG